MTDEQIWIEILGSCVVGKLYKSPFRKDIHPSCKLFRAGNNLVLYDHTIGKGYSAVYAYKELHGKDLKSRGATSYQAKPWYNFIPKSLGQLDETYFNQYGIIQPSWKPVKSYSKWDIELDEKITRKAADYTYGYKFQSGRVKFYQPKEVKERKFFGNSIRDDWFGEGDFDYSTLVIGSSLKDIDLLKRFLKASFRAPNGEGYEFTTGQIREIGRFERVLLMYDFDSAGFKGMDDRVCQINSSYPGKAIAVKPIVIGSKDYTDLWKENKSECQLLINTIKNEHKI